MPIMDKNHEQDGTDNLQQGRESDTPVNCKIKYKTFKRKNREKIYVGPNEIDIDIDAIEIGNEEINRDNSCIAKEMAESKVAVNIKRRKYKSNMKLKNRTQAKIYTEFNGYPGLASNHFVGHHRVNKAKYEFLDDGTAYLMDLRDIDEYTVPYSVKHKFNKYVVTTLTNSHS